MIKKLFLLLCCLSLTLPLAAQKQWYSVLKAWRSRGFQRQADKVLRQQNQALPRRPSSFPKRAVSSVKELEERVAETYQQVKHLQQEHFPDLNEIPFETLQKPLQKTELFSLQQNEAAWVATQSMLRKINWLRALPKQGKNLLKKVRGEAALERLAQEASREKLVFLGEKHFCYNAHLVLLKFLDLLKQQNPNRRIVLFSEFLFLPEEGTKNASSLASYYRRVQAGQVPKLTRSEISMMQYAGLLFHHAVRSGIDVYPLEDPVQYRLLEKELPKDGDLMNRAIRARNKTWARVMRAKMAEIRQTNPDALFVVFAGMGHTSWAASGSLPKFFADEKSIVLEVSEEMPSRHNLLYPVWGKTDPFFAPHEELTLYFWTGKNARQLGRQAGFDYALVAPLIFE